MNKKLTSALVLVLALGIAAGLYLAIAPSKQPAIAQGPPGGTPGVGQGQGGPAGWTDDGTVVRLTTPTDSVGIGTVNPSEKLEVIGNIALSGLIDGIDLSLKALGWDTAFNERRQWDGGVTNLDLTLGRSSLGLGSLAVLNAVTGGVGGKISDKTITADDLAALNNVVLKDTDGLNCHKLTVNAAGVLSIAAVDCATGEPLLSPPSAISEDFNSYADGPLAGNNGGLGWGGAWINSFHGSAFAIQGSTIYEGAKAVRLDHITDGSVVYRDFSSGKTQGIFSVRWKHENSGRNVQMKLNEGATSRGRIEFDSDGNIKIYNNAGPSWDTIQAYTTGPWYQIEVEFDKPNSQYRARVNGGSWTAWKMIEGGSMNQIDRLLFDMAGSGSTNSPVAYLDDITF